MKHLSTYQYILLLLIGTTLCGCNSTNKAVVTRQFIEPDQYYLIHPEAKFLKIHTTDGELFVLKKWEIQQDSSTIEGLGAFYDVNRKIITKKVTRTESVKSYYTIRFSDIQYFETNELQGNTMGSNRAYVILSAVTVGFTALLIGIILSF